MNVLLDTNSVLDVLLDRAPFVVEASAVWDACDRGRLVGFLPASTLTDIFYIARRTTDLARAQVAVGLCLAAFAIAPVDRQTLEDATALPGHDFEDNLLVACAIRLGVAAIVTRNGADFAHAPMPVLTPAELMAQL
ncbi:PIN domain-containing protein [Candidatus Chloroploca sp. Khr17]|uniref:type II toxin-antitoxin system VapC family toxin n=1 Tax=Candidatus Chloroploca sp. Khr17 TaxID=2496869 RepID=UPI00101D562F|nr:PIN domain-containing protein [Candidatus Chloroploca sp. Khr17]